MILLNFGTECKLLLLMVFGETKIFDAIAKTLCLH